MLYNKKKFKRDIVGVVCFFHICLLLFFITYDGKKFEQERFVIATKANGSTIVFMPLRKKIEQPVLKTDSQQSDKKSVMMTLDAYEKQKKIREAKKIGKSDKKAVQVAKKIAKKSTQLPKKVKVVAKQVNPIVSVNKPVMLEKKTSAILKELPVVSNTLIVQSPFTKPVDVKPAKKIDVALVKKVVEEKVKLKVEEKIAPSIDTKQENLSHSIVTMPAPVADQGSVDTKIDQAHEPVVKCDEPDQMLDQDQIIFIGSYDLQLSEMAEQIKQQATLYYKPPVGIAKNMVCQLAVTVGENQKATIVTIQKSSGSLANDMCARAALLQVVFPKQLQKRQIVVELGQ